MASALHVLLIDDSADDAELLIRALRHADFDPTWTRVDTAVALEHAFDTERWDVVISDWCMPNFSAPAAFAIMQAKQLDLPFIIVSGTIGEEVAVEALRAGAHDFLIKDRLARLAPAILRERREAELRRERRSLQEQLLLADRMASIGLLAAGVAHDLSNPLTCATANLLLACDQVERLNAHGVACDELAQELAEAREAVERMRSLVQDLKVFCRSDDERRTAVDLRQCLEFALRMAAPAIRPRARVVKEYGEVPLVYANGARIGQVLLNLLVNAAHAIESADASDHSIRVVTRTAADGRAIVEVHDTGCGIPKEVQEQLWRPFVTTKPVGVGTGLGLWISQSIIRALAGEITVDSQLGQGTSFSVALPPLQRTA